MNSSLDINRNTSAIAVLDDNNHRVIVFNQTNLTELIFIVSNSSNSTNSSMIHMSPSAITYDNNNALYILDPWERQLVKIDNPIEYGMNTTPVLNWNTSLINPPLNFTAAGLCIDNTDGSILISSYDSHQVFCFKPNSSMGTMCAGNGKPGNASNQLNNPTSIVIDNNQTL